MSPDLPEKGSRLISCTYAINPLKSREYLPA